MTLLLPLIVTEPPPSAPLALNWPVDASTFVVAAISAISPARPDVAFAVTVPATETEPADDAKLTLPPSVPLAETRPDVSTDTPWGAAIDTAPPLPCVPFASTVPATVALPESDCTVIEPPVEPFAVVVLPAASVTSFVALKTILPFSPRTAVLALTTPAWRINPPYMPILLAMIWPIFTAWLSGAVMVTRTSGEFGLTISTLFPAARIISPPSARMMPLF